MKHTMMSLCLFAAACGDGATDQDPIPQQTPDPDLDFALIQARPYDTEVPDSYTPGTPTPLVITLHGLGSNGIQQATFSGLRAKVDTRGFILAYPNGMNTAVGRGWNASIDGVLPLTADDLSYVRAVIADAKQWFSIDPDRVFVQGHSNGAFMANVLGCEAADVVAAIAPSAGTMWQSERSLCEPMRPMPVLYTHGTNDQTIEFDGGSIYNVAYVGALGVVNRWRELNGCGDTAVEAEADAAVEVVGAETTVSRFTCTGAPVELWSVEGGAHTELPTVAYVDAVLDFFFANPRR
jgi:polyhydroxybutyrate depolymerase